MSDKKFPSTQGNLADKPKAAPSVAQPAQPGKNPATAAPATPQPDKKPAGAAPKQ
jgi:hypothetical protein